MMIKSIGDYQVRAELGRGGMGRVYRAYDPHLDYEVAIKVLISEGDSDLLNRFRSEAGTTAKLRHPSIVTVHAFGEQDGLPYIVMELLEGQDLGHVIKKKVPLALLDKVRIMHQVGEGLSCAHQQNVVHRDIKPGNIMLLPNGSAKIMDFGIARVLGGESTRRTQQGFMIGTLQYMAPEQFKTGKDADQLTDIFAYGDVLYELISGVHPFQADDPGTQMFRITSVEPPSIQDLVPDCPDALANIVHQLLEKDRDLRYRSLRDVVLDLEPVLFQLRQTQAEQIMREAQSRIAAGDIEGALAAATQALGVDPVNREAQKLRNELQKRIQALSIRSKVDDLLSKADQLVVKRRLAEALPLLEDALRLDRSETVQKRLDDLKAKRAKEEQSARLLAESRHEAQKGNFVLASSKLAEALAIDPANDQAVRLGKWIREVSERLERERRVRETVDESLRRASESDFSGAFRLLDEAAQAGLNAEELDSARAQISGLKSDFDGRERQKRFDRDRNEIRTLLNSDRLPEAREAIGRFADEFSNWPSLEQELPGLLDTLSRLEQQAEVARIRRQVSDLIQQKQFDEAMVQVNEGLRRFPAHPFLRRSHEEVSQAVAARERAEDIARLTGVVALLRREDLEQAIQVVQTALRDFPEHSEFRTLAVELQLEREELWRSRQIQAALEKAESLYRHDPASASDLLSRELALRGPNAEIELLLERVNREMRERQEVQAVLAKAREFTFSRQWQKALEVLERGQKIYPQRPEFLQATEDVRAELDRITRAELLLQQHRAIENAIVRRDWTAALKLIDDTRAEFPGEQRTEELAEKLRSRRHEDEFSSFTSIFRQFLSADDISSAERLLDSAGANFENEPGWPTLLIEHGHRRSYLKNLAEARRLGDAGHIQEAEQVTRTAILNPARDRRAEDLLRTITDEQQARAATALLRESSPKEPERPVEERLKPGGYPDERGAGVFGTAGATETEAEPNPPRPALPQRGFLIGAAISGTLAAALLLYVLFIRPHGDVKRNVPAPAISITPSSVSLTYIIGSPDRPSAPVSIEGAHAQFRAISSAPWLSVEPVGGAVPGKLTVRANPDGLKPKSYKKEITITPSDPGQPFSSKSIAVQLEVIQPGPVVPKVIPTLTASPPSLSIQYREGDSTPAPQRLSVQGVDQANDMQISFEPSRNSTAWLSPRRISDGFLVTFRPDSLTAGQYSAVLLIGPKARQVRVPVALNIIAGASRLAAQELIRWEGVLPTGQIVEIRGDSASPGKLVAGELPSGPIHIEESTLSPGLKIESKPSTANNFTLRIRNSSADQVKRFFAVFQRVIM